MYILQRRMYVHSRYMCVCMCGRGNIDRLPDALLVLGIGDAAPVHPATLPSVGGGQQWWGTIQTPPRQASGGTLVKGTGIQMYKLFQ